VIHCTVILTVVLCDIVEMVCNMLLFFPNILSIVVQQVDPVLMLFISTLRISMCFSSFKM
jgi:hypothetical protein